MASTYIVAKQGWEYNDEVYYASRGGPEPKRAFEKLEDAVKVCDEMNLKAMKGAVLGHFIYPSDHPELTEFLDSKGVKYDEYDIEFPDGTPDDIIIKAFKICDINFYEVLQLEIE